jgi:predicted O-methyltransferase YrrM
MVAYDLSHLTQQQSQDVLGPIQDDEALFLFALIRVTRIKRVLEIGGLGGYSAKNFCAAVGSRGVVYTVDLEAVPKMAVNHRTIQKDARLLTRTDLDQEPLGLVFFDCHDYSAQLDLYHRLQSEGIITDRTLLALHDTNTHPTKLVPWAYPMPDGWVHQPVERRLVNDFKQMGYDLLVLGTDAKLHDQELPYRHGLAIASRFKALEV